MFKKRFGAIAVLALGVGIAVGPAMAASAAADPITGTKSCGSAPVPYVQVQSTATGRVNHEAGGVTWGSWNNGGTYTTRASLTNYTSAYWRVFLTGSGGDISYGSAVCHS